MKKIKELHSYFLQSSGICTDTRKITENCLFFALKGENFNGNKFADEALEKGAFKVVIDDIRYHRNTGETILFGSSLKALQKLATFHRQELGIPILSLTGSNGKTTTKELINAVLSQKFKTTATQGNFNNHIGVPLTLLSMNSKTEMGVVEMGANHQKEIDALCEIALPDYGYITNFGKAHLEGFGGIEGVIKGKTELYRHLKARDKMVFVNGNDPRQLQYSKGMTQYTFGNEAQDCHIQLKNASGKLIIAFKDQTIETNLIGVYNFHNAAAAIAIGAYFEVPAPAIKKAIENYIPDNNRSQLITRGSNQIILDAYNANPTSMMAALENFAQSEGDQKIMFLGDMFELGVDADAEHQNIVNYLEQNPFGKAYLIGEHFARTETEGTDIARFATFENLAEFLKSNVPKNSAILIKASRGMALERILDLI